jgi:hypothetical protein
MTVKLKALKEYPYDNKTRKAGDIFEANDSDADALVTTGLAEVIEKYQTKVMTTETSEPIVPGKRGRYPRRDMRAEE